MKGITPDPEHLVVLALVGALPEDQTREVLASVTFKGATTMSQAALEQTLNRVSDTCRMTRPQRLLAEAFLTLKRVQATGGTLSFADSEHVERVVQRIETHFATGGT